MSTENFYRAFEDKYRGNRNLVKGRLKVYLPFITPLFDSNQDSGPQALDLGCGRGEWLELLKEHGFIAHGVDIDEGMLEACKKLNLNAEEADALGFLKAQKDNSMAVISGFHIAEHIPFEKLQELVKQALRVLIPSGLFILETPNPENIVVGTTNFYMDPTHHRPLPPELLMFIAEHAGYERIKLLRLQEPKDLLKLTKLSLHDVLSGVSPDYSIIAQKTAEESTLKKFDSAFAKKYGISLNKIAKLYDEQMKSTNDAFTSEIETEHKRIEQLAIELNTTKEDKSAAEIEKQYLEKSIKLKEQQLEVLIEEKANLKAEVKSECQHTKQVAAEVSKIKKQYSQLSEHAQWLQNEWNAAKNKVDELNYFTQHWQMVADKTNHELQSVYKSKSWRITWPLRKLLELLFLNKDTHVSQAPPKKVINTTANPEAASEDLTAPTSQGTEVINQSQNIESLEHLTPTARAVYRNLKVAIDIQHGRDC